MIYSFHTASKEEQFGLTTLKKKDGIYAGIQQTLKKAQLWLGDGSRAGTIKEAVEGNKSNVIVASEQKPDVDLKALEIDDGSGVRDRIPLFKALLDEGKKVIFLEKAHNGVDLHLFSRDNLYEPLFYALKPLVGPGFRYFSINGKRLSGERMFYFETWTLDHPPHGFEEVALASTL